MVIDHTIQGSPSTKPALPGPWSTLDFPGLRLCALFVTHAQTYIRRKSEANSDPTPARNPRVVCNFIHSRAESWPREFVRDEHEGCLRCVDPYSQFLHKPLIVNYLL